MNDVLLDRLELSFLNGLQDQRVMQSQVRANTQAGLQAMRSSGMPAATATTPTSSNGASTTEEADAGSIINRSPTINHNYYPQAPIQAQPTPAPVPAPQPTSKLSPWWLVVPALIALAGATYLLWPKPTPATTPTTAPAKPGGENADTTIILRDLP